MDPTAVDGALVGRRALGRALTALEEGRDPVLGPRAQGASTTTSRVLGVTGPPGAGKSTVVAALATAFRARDLTVAVLAVDPSDEQGGALLGDRMRMSAHAGDAGVYVRSWSARGALGGLSSGLWEAVGVCEENGFDVVIVETVGVGQSERDVAQLADSVVFVGSSDMGDHVQFAKAGVMELCDVVAVNKADLPEARAVARRLRRARALRTPSEPSSWAAPVVLVEAASGLVDPLVDVLDAHADWLAAGGRRARRRRGRARAALRQALRARFEQLLDRAEATGGFDIDPPTGDEPRGSTPAHVLERAWREIICTTDDQRA